MNKKYIIEEDRLIKLLGNEFELSELRKGGVDRWGLYGIIMWESLDRYREKNMLNKERSYSVYDIALDKLKNFEEYEEWEFE